MKLGDKITFTHEYRRETKAQGGRCHRTWEEKPFSTTWKTRGIPVKGIIIGFRYLRNGSIPIQDGFDPNDGPNELKISNVVKVLLVSYSMYRNPVYVDVKFATK